VCTESHAVLLVCVFFLLMALCKNVPCVSQLLVRCRRSLGPTFTGAPHTAEVRPAEVCLGQVRLMGRVEGAVHHVVLRPPKPTMLLGPHLAKLAGACQATRKLLWWGRISLSSFSNAKPPQLLPASLSCPRLWKGTGLPATRCCGSWSTREPKTKGLLPTPKDTNVSCCAPL